GGLVLAQHRGRYGHWWQGWLCYSIASNILTYTQVPLSQCLFSCARRAPLGSGRAVRSNRFQNDPLATCSLLLRASRNDSARMSPASRVASFQAAKQAMAREFLHRYWT